MKSLASLLFGVLVWSILTAATCNNPTGAQQDPLLGEWVWIQTSFQTRGMPTPTISTPASTGVAMTVDFSANNTVAVKHNGTTIHNCSYKITENAEGTRFINVLLPEEAPTPNIERHGILRIDNNQLEIIGGYNDAGANQQFQRKK